jgi:hypothetical protein
MEIVVIQGEEDGEGNSSLKGAKSPGSIVVRLKHGVVILNQILVSPVLVLHLAILNTTLSFTDVVFDSHDP